jgi:hypothetical protein
VAQHAIVTASIVELAAAAVALLQAPRQRLLGYPQAAALPTADDKEKHQHDERDPRIQNRPKYLRIYGNRVKSLRE